MKVFMNFDFEQMKEGVALFFKQHNEYMMRGLDNKNTLILLIVLCLASFMVLHQILKQSRYFEQYPLYHQVTIIKSKLVGIALRAILLGAMWYLMVQIHVAVAAVVMVVSGCAMVDMVFKIHESIGTYEKVKDTKKTPVAAISRLK